MSALFVLFRPLYVWHSFVVTFRHGFGRWYVFRDRPQWFVEEMAEIDVENPDPDETISEDVVALVREARAEVEARKRQKALTQ